MTEERMRMTGYQIEVPAEEWAAFQAGMRSYEDDIRAHRVIAGIYHLSPAETVDVQDLTWGRVTDPDWLWEADTGRDVPYREIEEITADLADTETTLHAWRTNTRGPNGDRVTGHIYEYLANEGWPSLLAEFAAALDLAW